jgi:hypothetical protein
MNGYSRTPASWAASRIAEGSRRARWSTSLNVVLDSVVKAVHLVHARDVLVLDERRLAH